MTFKRDFSPLSDQLLGYGSMFGTFTPDKQTKTFIDYPELVDLTKKIPNQVLRFPGGTDAHFYDWDTGKPVKAADIDHPAMRRNLKAQKNVVVTIGEFLTLCNQVGAKPTITLPIYQKDADYIIDLVDRLKTQFPNQDFPMWELGNEHGLELAWKKKRLEADDYIHVCRAVGQHLMQEFPNSLVAVTGEGYPRRGRAKEWNRTLADANDADPFFNAVVLHKYMYVPKKAATCTVNEKIDLLFAGVEHEASNAEKVGNDYFGGMPLMMTEIGIAGVNMTNPDQSDDNQQIQQLWWVTELANLDYLLAFMDRSQDYPFHAVLRHMLLVKNKGKLGRAALQWEITDDPNQPNIRQGWNIVSHSLLEVLLDEFEGGEYASAPYKKSTRTCSVLKYKNKSYSPLRIGMFRKDGKRGFYILNKTDQPFTIDLAKGTWNVQSVATAATALPQDFGPKDSMIQSSTEKGCFTIQPYSFNIGIQ